MSPDPHAPTPAGPDPDEGTEVRPPADDAFAPPVDEPATDDSPTASSGVEAPAAPAADEPTAPTPTVSFADATQERPAGTVAPEDDWLDPDAAVFAAAPVSDSPARKGPGFTPLGTAEGSADPVSPAPASSPLDQAKALTERPEVMVGLAFVGGAVASFVLKRFGR